MSRPHFRFTFVISMLLLCGMAIPGTATDVTYTGQTIAIAEPGTYVLTNDITNSNQLICIEIQASDVVLDGAGHLIDGLDTENSAGIYVHGSSPVSNVTIRNVRVQDWYYGIYLYEASNSSVEASTLSSNLFTGAVAYRNAVGNTITGCTITGNNYGAIFSDRAANGVVSDNQIDSNGRGMYVYFSDGITVAGNTITDNTYAGLQIHTSGGGSIYNNRLSNDLNAVFYGEPFKANTWSVTPQAGPNIMNGPNIGGNYWGRPDGIGFSQTNADADSDGFADARFEIAPLNVDDYPLAPSVGFTPTPFATPTPDPTPTPETPTPEPSTPTPTPTLPTTPNLTIPATPVMTYSPTPPTPTLTATPSPPGGATDVTYSGQKIVINRPGTYVLKNDITNSNQLICIEIQASNVVFDGANHLIDGLDTENSAGIFVHGPSAAVSGVTIKNVRMQDWYYGVYLYEARYSRIEASTLASNAFTGAVFYKNAAGNTLTGCTITGNSYGAVFSDGAAGGVVSKNAIKQNERGLYVYLSDGITVTGNTITDNSNAGLQLHTSGGGTIYNNKLVNNLSVAFTGEPFRANEWAATPGANWRPANIMGGPQVGGNYWGRPNNTGFSQVNPDANGDGFCDTPLTLADLNVDDYPLAIYSSAVPSPSCTGCYTPDPTEIPTTTGSTGNATPTPTAPITTPTDTIPPTGSQPTSAATLPTPTTPPLSDGGNGTFYLDQTRPARVGEIGAVTLYMDSTYQSLATDVRLEITWDGEVLGYSGTDWKIDGFNLTESAGTGELVLKFTDLTNGDPNGRTAIAEINFEVLNASFSPLRITVLQGQSHFGPGQVSFFDWTSLATVRAGTFRPITVVPGGAGYPGDPDGDGRYEDVNGNGRPDFADVVLLFNQMSWIADHAPVSVFDYNNNGRIEFADVVARFNTL